MTCPLPPQTTPPPPPACPPLAQTPDPCRHLNLLMNILFIYLQAFGRGCIGDGGSGGGLERAEPGPGLCQVVVIDGGQHLLFRWAMALPQLVTTPGPYYPTRPQVPTLPCWGVLCSQLLLFPTPMVRPACFLEDYSSTPHHQDSWTGTVG